MPETISKPGFRWFPLPRGFGGGHAAPAPRPRVLTIVDALGGGITETGVFPHTLADGRPGKPAAAVVFAPGEGGLTISPVRADTDPLVNGAALRDPAPLPENETLTLQLGHGLWFIRYAADAGWPAGFDRSKWSVFDSSSGTVLGSADPEALPALVEKLGAHPSTCAACPAGLDTGFVLAQILHSLRKSPATPSQAGLPEDCGRHFCPACWKHFDSGDALSIATHEELMGDPGLGPDHRLRFHPTRFTDAGVALDPLGTPSPDLACPHCRRRLPHGYLDTEHRVLSLVGAPGAGKSYFLAALTRMLQDGLFRDFGMTLRDDDPTGNMLLNQMRNRLFSARTPEDAVLGKTAFEGAFYERTTRAGRTVSLPRPFVYTVCNQGGRDASIILYDNAGEHFEPGVDYEDSPGALHVARSAGLFFLFDPTSSGNFRAELEGKATDPQLRQAGRIDQQDTILFEMDVRIKRTLGLIRSDRIDTPLAVLIGKCDVWRPIFDAANLHTPVAGRTLDLDRVDLNSGYLRSMLLDLCPALVSGAEAISSDVRYFAVSALGHSPEAILEGPKAGMLAPNPARLAPYGIDVAAYWLISRAYPGVIPTRRSAPQA